MIEQTERQSHTFRDEWALMPPLHKVSVGVSLVFLLGLCIEGAFLVPYVVARWGWGYVL